MDPRRTSQHEYGRSRGGGDGGGYGAHPSSSGRAIPPKAVPSLSTGQGFYTVESLQGATMVPPPQPAPPPPRFMTRLEPHARDFAPPHLHPAHRPDFGPFDRRYPPPAAVGRKMMLMPMRHGGPPMLHHRPPYPPFMADPRMPRFHPGRWGPGEFERRAFDRSRDQAWASQRMMTKKHSQRLGKPASQSKDKKSLADKQNAGEGGPGWCALCKVDCSNAESLKMHISGRRHKKQAESHTQVNEPRDNAKDAKEEGGTIASSEANETMVTGGLEKVDDLALETMTVDVPEGEGNSQKSDEKSVAGMKRVSTDMASPSERPCKAAALSDATNCLAATITKVLEDVTDGIGIQKSSDPDVAEMTTLDAHAKAADNGFQTSSISLKLKVNGDELPTSEQKPISESVKESSDEEKEVRNVTNLANGTAGQSAEIQ